MKNYYITESTKSLEDYTRSYEALLPHTTITCEANTEKFKSDAHGIISDQFYIGSNTTEYLSSIEVLDTASCILSITSYKHNSGLKLHSNRYCFFR